MSAAMSDALCRAVESYSLAERAGEAWYAAQSASEREAAWAMAEAAAIRAQCAQLAAAEAMAGARDEARAKVTP